ncbi:unnamed protein product [Tetraodon nigroviridis]|uniref:(spotted green pufferfish) hypothetical protein n=1 Tax=Tetraodon nigroviridis TaxID=99883 RepID=Q4RVZ7_TETNG|nr:unnamed protein product [Tetraodon nigroviridis]
MCLHIYLYQPPLYPYGQLPVSQLSPCREEVSAEDQVSGR